MTHANGLTFVGIVSILIYEHSCGDCITPFEIMVAA